jgi:hypothetical protein
MPFTGNLGVTHGGIFIAYSRGNFYMVSDCKSDGGEREGKEKRRGKREKKKERKEGEDYFPHSYYSLTTSTHFFAQLVMMVLIE